MMEMPIRLKVVSEPPELKICGNASNARCGNDPRGVEFEAGRPMAGRGGAMRRGDIAHVSRVPIRPIGRKISISTSSR